MATHILNISLERAGCCCLINERSEAFHLDLTEDVLRDCLWLSFSDSVVFSKQHRDAALMDNVDYRQMFRKHLALVETFTALMGTFF